eukprot:UN33412
MRWDTAFIMQIHEPLVELKQLHEVYTVPERRLMRFIDWICWFCSAYRYTSENNRPMILIATGAGCAYIIDLVHFILANDINLVHTVHIVFSSRSVELFQFISDCIMQRRIPNMIVNGHITKAKLEFAGERETSDRMAFVHRADLQNLIETAHKETVVYYCGAPK